MTKIKKWVKDNFSKVKSKKRLKKENYSRFAGKKSIFAIAIMIFL